MARLVPHNTFGDDKIRICQLRIGKRLDGFAGVGFPAEEINTLAFSLDGERLAGVERTKGRSVPGNSIWQVKTGRFLHTLEGKWIDAIAISRDGNLLISGDGLL